MSADHKPPCLAAFTFGLIAGAALLCTLLFATRADIQAEERGFDQGMERAGCGAVSWGGTIYPVIGYVEDDPRGYLCPGTENGVTIYFDPDYGPRRGWKGPQ